MPAASFPVQPKEKLKFIFVIHRIGRIETLSYHIPSHTIQPLYVHYASAVDVERSNGACEFVAAQQHPPGKYHMPQSERSNCFRSTRNKSLPNSLTFQHHSHRRMLSRTAASFSLLRCNRAIYRRVVSVTIFAPMHRLWLF